MAIAIKKGQRISQFVVREVLPEGIGGMATVVRAAGLDEVEVALKISRSAAERYYADALIFESEILQKLDHPGVVRILPIHTDIGKTRYMERATELTGYPWFFVMEFLQGGSLRDWLKRVNILAPGDACFIAGEVAKALEYVHAQKYVHNDVKPDNVLFRHKLESGGNFEPVLIDFGIAAKTRRIQRDAGSLQWMSPERLRQVRNQLAPEQRMDATKVDVYAVGVMLYRMLTAKMPFTGITEEGVTSAILNKNPERIQSANSEVSSGLDELILACMEKRPEARPSMHQLIEGLAEFSTDRMALGQKHQSRRGAAQVRRNDERPTETSLISSSGTIFSIRGNGVWIGRPDRGYKPEINIDLEDDEENPTSSRRHAQIFHKEGKYILRPKPTLNGTFVNGVEIRPYENCVLKDGDILRFGDVEFTFRTI